MLTVPPIGRSAASSWPVLAAFLVIAATLLTVASRHEIEHDEAQAWNIARSAASPFEIPWISRFEGHTPPWFVLLWTVGRFGGVWTMQALSAVLALAFIALLLRDRPFGALATVAIACGYYPIYEYAIIARPYVVTLFLTGLFAASYFRDPERDPWLPVLVCVAMASMSAYSALLSLPLVCYVLANVDPRADGARLRIAAIATAWLISLAACAWFVLLPHANTDFEARMLEGDRLFVASALDILRPPAWPHLDRLRTIANVPDLAWSVLIGTSTLAVHLAVCLRLRHDRKLLGAWLLAVAAVAGGASFSGLDSERHLGHLWMAAVAFCWVDAGRRRLGGPHRASGRADRAADTVLIAALGWHVVVGAGIAALDASRPLAPWNDLATAVEQTMPEATIVTEYSYIIGPMLALLDRPAHDVGCDCMTRHYEWTTPITPAAERLDALERAWCGFAAAGEDVVVVANGLEPLADAKLEFLEEGFVSLRPADGSRLRATKAWRLSEDEIRRCWAASGP